MNCELESLTTATSEIQAEQAITGRDINRGLLSWSIGAGQFLRPVRASRQGDGWCPL